MSYRILFSPEANDDLTDILGWYKESPNQSLHKQFITALSKSLRILETIPEAYPLRYKNARCAVLKKFPFNIYYWIDVSDMSVNIFALLHQSRNPVIWEDRV